MRITFFIIIFLFISCTSNINKIDKELDKLAKTVKNNLDIKTIESMIK